jgi:hypothetical protein
MVERYNSMAVLTYAMQEQPQPQPRVGAPTSQSWWSWLFSGLESSNSGADTGGLDEGSSPILPSWCPDWREQYSLSKDPEAVSRPSISRHDLKLHPQIAISGSGTLTVTGVTLATVQAPLDHGVDVSIPLNIRHCTRDLAATCSRINEYLHSLSKSTNRRLRKGDCICLLSGCTVIAILRPIGTYLKLVLMGHSKFDQFRHQDVFPKPEQIFGLDIREPLRWAFQKMEII